MAVLYPPRSAGTRLTWQRMYCFGFPYILFMASLCTHKVCVFITHTEANTHGEPLLSANLGNGLGPPLPQHITRRRQLWRPSAPHAGSTIRRGTTSSAPKLAGKFRARHYNHHIFTTLFLFEFASVRSLSSFYSSSFLVFGFLIAFLDSCI